MHQGETCVTPKTPQACAVKQLNVNCECGFAFLEKLLCKLAPHLGGSGVDMTDDVNQLIIQPGEQLSDFQF